MPGQVVPPETVNCFAPATGTAQPRTLPEALRNLAVQPDRPAAGVDFGELHLQVTGQPGVVEVAGCDVFAGRFAQEFGQRVGERLFAEDPSRLERFAEAFDRLRDRARLLAYGLRQRTDQQFNLVAEPARNEVVERPARRRFMRSEGTINVMPSSGSPGSNL